MSKAVHKPEDNVTRYAGRQPPREHRVAFEGSTLNAASKASKARSRVRAPRELCGRAASPAGALDRAGDRATKQRSRGESVPACPLAAGPPQVGQTPQVFRGLRVGPVQLRLSSGFNCARPPLDLPQLSSLRGVGRPGRSDARGHH